MLDIAVFVLDRNDVAFADEKARDVTRGVEQPAAVAREIEEQANRFGVGSFAKQVAKVRRAIAFARGSAPVEGREVDDGELLFFAVNGERLKGKLRGLLFEIDLVAFDRHHKAFGLGRLPQDGEVHLSVALAAYEAHHFTQVHVDDIDRLFTVLRDCDDFVVGEQFADAMGGAARDHLFDDRISVARRKCDPDPDQRKPHLDLEVFVGLLGKVARVRIERGRECVEEQAVGVFLIELSGALQRKLVAVDELLFRLGEFHVGAEVVRHLEVDQLLEKRVLLGFVFWT